MGLAAVLEGPGGMKLEGRGQESGGTESTHKRNAGWFVLLDGSD